MNPEAMVVTATVGEPSLSEAVASVQRQTYRPLRHVVVIDGAPHERAARAAIAAVPLGDVPIEVVALEVSTGHSGHFGHRIYATSEQLGSGELVFFLDADNYFDPVHVDECAQAIIGTGAMWAYALRRIVDRRGTFFCADDCDSLGFWPRYRTHYLGHSLLPPDEEKFLRAAPHLVDTSCYALRREVLARWFRCWEVGPGADGIFATELVRHEVGIGTGRRTVGYRLDVTTRPSTADYFLKGNDLTRQLYGSTLPWITSRPGLSVSCPDELGVRFGT